MFANSWCALFRAHCKRRAEVSKSIAGVTVVLVGRRGRLGTARRGDAAGWDVAAHSEHVAEGGGEVSSAQTGNLGEVVAIALTRVSAGGKEESAVCSFTSVEENCQEAAKLEKDSASASVHDIVQHLT